MNTTSSVAATCVLVAVGKWSQDEEISVQIVVGGMFLALGLSIMSEGNPKFGERFAFLILVVALFMYGPAIAYKMGLTSRKPPNWGGLIRSPRPRTERHGRPPVTY